MNMLALLMILASAVSHATWNFLAKRTHGGAPFAWLTDVLSVLFYAPLVGILFMVQRWSLSLAGIVLMAGSAVLHLAYFLLLQKGYRLGDLSLVYPLTRGTGSLLSALGAIVLLGERPTPIALAGMLLVVVGLFLLTGGLCIFSASTGHLVLRYGTLTSLLIACYTLWDKLAVSGAHISPLPYNYGVILIRGALLSPYALRHWHMVRLDWHEHRLEVYGVAVLSFLAYFLVLTALPDDRQWSSQRFDLLGVASLLLLTLWIIFHPPNRIALTWQGSCLLWDMIKEESTRPRRPGKYELIRSLSSSHYEGA